MSEVTLQLLTTLRARLRAGVRRWVWADVLFGVLVTMGVLGALLLAFVALEAALWLGVGERTVLFAVLVLALLGLLGWYVALPLIRLGGWLGGLDESFAAQRAAQRYPEVGDRLSALLDLADGRGSTAPSGRVDRAVQRLGSQVEPVPFEQIEDLRPARRAAPWAVTPMLGLALFAFIAPADFAGALHRLSHPATFFARPDWTMRRIVPPHSGREQVCPSRS